MSDLFQQSFAPKKGTSCPTRTAQNAIADALIPLQFLKTGGRHAALYEGDSSRTESDRMRCIPR